MFKKRALVSFGIGVSFIFAVPALLSADIYRYQDESGIWHYTNIKTDRRYKLYIRSYQKEEPAGFIKKYNRIIIQASRTFKVDSSLIKAVIKAESDFDHKAVSHKGAKGLMQLMPDTANDMDVGNPLNPEENILGGTRYLGLLLERFKNNKTLALAAYNAGPEKVEYYRGVPPYPETKTFIKRVLDYYRKYQNDR
ncbi:MAG: lytic transglycosylase domain-containing protein [Pseudomonadota bacterium]